MILCHKCDGTFTIVSGLYTCSCMSGYPRGFENELTMEQALAKQASAKVKWLALYRSQERTEEDIEYCMQRYEARA